MTSERARRHVRAPRKVLHGQGRAQPADRPFHDRGETRGRSGRDRLADVLRLPTLPMRRHHHAPGHLVRDLGAVVAADEVEAEVDAGRAPRRGEDVALVDVEHVRLHADARVARAERVVVAPVRGRALAVQQAGRGQDEDAGADRHQARPAAVRVAERIQERARRRLGRTAPARDHDGACRPQAPRGARRPSRAPAPLRESRPRTGTTARAAPAEGGRRPRPRSRTRTCPGRRRRGRPRGGCAAAAWQDLNGYCQS